VLSPAGQLLTVTDASLNEVVTMKLDAASGRLTKLGSARARALPVSVAISTGATPAGWTPRLALAGGDGEQDVRSYQIDSVTGALTPTGTAGTNYVQSIALHPRLPVAYAVGSGPVMQQIIEQFTLDLTAGTATLVTPSAASGGLPVAIVMEPSGRFAYLVHESKNSTDLIWQLTIDQATGALTKLPGTTWNPGIGPVAAAVDPSGTFFYVLNKTTSDISAYQVNPNSGALAPVGGSPFPAGVPLPTTIAIHTSGHMLYVSNGSMNGSHTIDLATGALGPVVTSTIGAGQTIAVYPSGEFLLSAGPGAFGSTTTHPVSGIFDGPGSGLGTLAGYVAAATAPDPSGRFAYTVEFTLNPAPDGKVVPFTTNPGGGYVMTASALAAVAGPLGGRVIVVRGRAW
jgi:6-phosphogluconolactonase (cycloisomerase 2 family)